MKIDLNRIAFIGRTFHEYSHMFGLDDDLLRGRVLDCPAGASSFTAECIRQGYDVTACDILYDIEPGKLIKKARADTVYALEQAYKVKDLYDWSFYGSVEEHAAQRMEALGHFSADFPTGIKEGRYVQGELPRLPFDDDSFSLVLSSHFLFLYSDRLDFQFHFDCLKELLRVGEQVRVYPLAGLDGKQYPLLGNLLAALGTSGAKAHVRNTQFRFMREADRMLVLTR